MPERRHSARRRAGAGPAAAGALLPLLLAGCGSFFNPKPASTGTGSGSGSGGSGAGTTVSSVYVANSNTALDSLVAFSLSSTGLLANLRNSPAALGVTPSALAISPNGKLLFVGSELGTITPLLINSDGSLTAASANTTSVAASSMVVDPTGQWLLVESNIGLGSPPSMYVYQINQTDGALTAAGTGLQLDNGSGAQLVIAPGGTLVYAALGASPGGGVAGGGVDGLSFNPSNGALTKLTVYVAPGGNGYADNGLAIDPGGKYLFVAETGSSTVRVFSIATNGALAEVPGSPFQTGAGTLGAKAVLVDPTGSYVYVTNSTQNTVSAFSLAADGTLTLLAGSPFLTGASPYALAEDSTGSFLTVACAGGSPDLQVFAIAGATAQTPGALLSVATASTGSATVEPAGATAVVTTP